MKFNLEPKAASTLEAMVQDLFKINPYMETKASRVLSELVLLVHESNDASFKQSLAARLTSISGRRRALMDQIKSLSETEDQETLLCLEKGLSRLKVRFKKQGSSNEPKD